MSQTVWKYIIVGGGLTGASAIEGIRERDPNGPILMYSTEEDLPYQRPPLSKDLWTKGMPVEKIFCHDKDYYRNHGVEVRLQTNVSGIDPKAKTIQDDRGHTEKYERLLLATGGSPRRLDIPGGELEQISYYRTLHDYRILRESAGRAKSAIIIGGGFIGSELAAALTLNKINVTMIFPSPWLVSKIFPASLAQHLTEQYRQKGVTINDGDAPVSIEHGAHGFSVQTRQGRTFKADLLAAGIGITLNLSLAHIARLKIDNGIVVDEFLQTSVPDIYAAGDVARFPMSGYGPRRLEHYDNATSQGKHAGRNMAGAHEPFTYIPFFYSDLFEFGYEAVGDIDSRLVTFEDWQEPYKTGVIYYLDGDRLRGAMMCNVWEKTQNARDLIRKGGRATHETLKGAIR